MSISQPKNVSQLETRVYDNWLATYMEYTNDTEAPRHFHLWVGISVIASMLERKVWVDLGAFHWVPNFFTILVGEPGIVTKSTSMNIGKALAERTNRVKFGPSSLSWQALLDAFEEVCQEFPVGNDRYMQSSLSCWISEFGNFFDPSNRDFSDLLTNMWDGWRGSFTRRTRKDGEKHIVNPWLNLIACVTPSWLQDNLTTSLIGGGLVSRMIFVLGTKKHKLIAYPGISSSGLRKDLEDNLVKDLTHIGKLRGPMTLTPEALEWGTDWYQKHHQRRDDGFGGRMAGYNARKQAHLHKLAMIMSVAEGDSLLIEKHHLTSALKLLFACESDMGQLILQISGKDRTARNSQEVLTALQHSAVTVSKKQLYNALWTMMSSKEYDNAVTDLVRAGKINMTAAGPGDAILSLLVARSPRGNS